jgi:hypothetical protein
MFVCAGIAVPMLVWFGWGTVLQSKYGVFTTGYQLKWNLLDQNTREEADRNNSDLLVLRDTSRSLDSYMVVDNMFPGSPLWFTRLKWGNTIRLISNKERQNIPMALKEIAILVTPGGLLAAALALFSIQRRVQQPESRFIGIVLLESAALVIAYCMLVFGARYVLPLAPLLMAVGVPFVIPTRRTRLACACFRFDHSWMSHVKASSRLSKVGNSRRANSSRLCPSTSERFLPPTRADFLT